jgi:peptidyl-tRNA hydrolase, PTH2 family
MNIKQVIVMRRDLHMRRGKKMVQASHASMKVFFDMSLHKTEHEGTINYHIILPPGEIGKDISAWVDGIFKKICCSVNSEEELITVYEKAQDQGLPCALIKDSGITEFGGVPTYTCCAIGPARAELIDVITGDLPLL